MAPAPEDLDSGVADATSAPAVEPREGIGALLRARRLELGMSPGDVAASLKITARRIVALEEERWNELPDGPFLRGFLRNVARTLHLDASVLLERVDASLIQTRTPESILAAPGVAHAMMPRRSGRLDDRRNSFSWIVGACVFALIAAGIAWSGTESFDRTMTSGRSLFAGTRSSPAAPIAAAASEAAPSTAAIEPSATVADVTTPASESTPQPSTAASTAASVASSPNQNARPLVFHFNEESWIEVKSADGKILTQRLNAAGSDQEIDGTAPFSLIVGNAKGVDVRFRGQPVDLGPHIRDQVARLTLP